MTDYQRFKYGAVTYPVPSNGAGLGGPGATFLRDGDPALFYLLEYCKAMIEKHLGDRLMAECASADIAQIPAPVVDVCPINPEPYLTEEHFRFPLLSAYRKSSKFEWVGTTKHIVDDVELSYVLPPMQAGEAERLIPLLHGVAKVLDNRIEQGFDPSYTPSTPAGTAGEQFWIRAGVIFAGVKDAEYGGYAPTENLYFPCVRLTLTLKEKSDLALDDFEDLDGMDVNEDLADGVQDIVTDFVQFEIDSPNELGTEDGESLASEGDEDLWTED